MQKALYTRNEVAAMLSVCWSTVKALARRGELEEVRIGPRSPRITAESVDRYLGKVKNEAQEQAYRDIDPELLAKTIRRFERHRMRIAQGGKH